MSEGSGQKRMAIALAIVAFVLAGAALVVAIARRGGGGSESKPDAPIAKAPAPRAHLVDRTHAIVPPVLSEQLLTELRGPVQRGSILEQLGFHDGDVIRGLNGMEVSTPDLMQQLKSARQLTIDYDREGSALQLEVEIR